MKKRTWMHFVAMLLAVELVAAACGDDGQEAVSDAGTAAAEAAAAAAEAEAAEAPAEAEIPKFHIWRAGGPIRGIPSGFIAADGTISGPR